MHNLPRVEIKRKNMSTARRLIVSSIDFKSGEMAQQERANAAMSDYENVAVGRLAEDLMGFLHNPALGVRSRLPSSNAFFWLCKKLVGNLFELRAGQKPCRASIILVRAIANDDLEADLGRQDIRRVYSLSFGARIDRCGVFKRAGRFKRHDAV